MRLSRSAAVVAVALLLAVGCSSASKSPPVSQVDPPATGEKTTIRLTVLPDHTERMLDLLIPAFEAKYPQYQMEKVVFTDVNLARKAATNGQLDVFPVRILGRPEAKTYAKPLDTYLTKARLDTAPYGSLLDDLQVEGRLYELPFSADLGLILYNPEMAKAAGVAIPADGWTWDEFREAVAKLSQSQGEPKVLGLETTFHEILLRLWLEGRTGKPAGSADLKALRDGIGFFHTMAFTDQSIPPAPQFAITEGGVAAHYSRRLFSSLVDRQAAMTFELHAYFVTLQQLGTRVAWDVAPMPAAPGARPILPASPLTLGIAAGSTKPDAAWDFVAFAAGPEGGATLARAGFPPAYLGEVTREAWAEHSPPYPAGMQSIWSARWKVYLGMSPAGEKMTHRDLEFQKAQNWALSGRKTIEEALSWFIANEGGK